MEAGFQIGLHCLQIGLHDLQICIQDLHIRCHGLHICGYRLKNHEHGYKILEESLSTESMDAHVAVFDPSGAPCKTIE